MCASLHSSASEAWLCARKRYEELTWQWNDYLVRVDKERLSERDDII